MNSTEDDVKRVDAVIAAIDGREAEPKIKRELYLELTKEQIRQAICNHMRNLVDKNMGPYSTSTSFVVEDNDLRANILLIEFDGNIPNAEQRKKIFEAAWKRQNK